MPIIIISLQTNQIHYYPPAIRPKHGLTTFTRAFRHYFSCLWIFDIHLMSEGADFQSFRIICSVYVKQAMQNQLQNLLAYMEFGNLSYFRMSICLYLVSHYCTKKRKHSFHILKALFSSDTRQSMKRWITTERWAEIYTKPFGRFGRYPTFHTMTSVQRKRCFQYVKRMFPLFRAIVKLCSTNRLFTYLVSFIPVRMSTASLIHVCKCALNNSYG